MAGEANLDPQVAIRAAVPKEAARRMPEKPRAGQAPGESRRQEQELRDAIAKRGMGEKPAEDLQSVLETRDNTSADSQHEAILANFGTETDPQTHERLIPDASRPLVEAAQRFDRLATEIVEKNGNIDMRNPDVKRQFDELMAAADLANIPPDVRRVIDSAMLRDPGFIRELARGHAENLAKRVPGLEELVEARNKRDQADASFDSAKKQHKDAGDAVDKLEKRRDSFDSNNPDPDSDYVKLQKLEAENLDPAQRAASNDLREIQKEVDGLISLKTRANAPADIDSKIDDAKTRRDAAQDRLDEANRKITERNNLREEKNNLPQKLEEATQRLREAVEAYGAADAERQKAGSEYASAFHKREAELRTWVAEKGNLVRDAWQRVIDERVRVANEAHAAEMDERVNKAKDEKEKKLAENRRKRFFSKDSRGKPKINNDAIREDMSKLTNIDINGAEELYIQDLRGAGYGEEEINQMKADKEKWNGALSERAQDVATAFIKNNGTFRNRNRLTEAEASFIASQPWGEGLIQKAKESAQGQKVDKMLKDAGIKDGILDKRISKKTLLELLIGGVIAAGAMVGVSVAGNL